MGDVTNEEMTQLFVLLRTMPSVTPWTDGHRQLYAIVLRDWSVQLGRQVVEAATLSEEWRPSPARLRKIAARLASPYPDAEEVYAEILHKAQTIGVYGRPEHYGSASWMSPGTPAMSHPIVAQVVGLIGGWLTICHGEAQMQEGLKKQVRSAHESAAGRWEARVLEQLSLAPPHRDPLLFRAYRPYCLPEGYCPSVQGDVLGLGAGLEEPEDRTARADRDQRAAMPDRVVESLRNAGFDPRLLERIGRGMRREPTEVQAATDEEANRARLRRQAAFLLAEEARNKGAVRT